MRSTHNQDDTAHYSAQYHVAQSLLKSLDIAWQGTLTAAQADVLCMLKEADVISEDMILSEASRAWLNTLQHMPHYNTSTKYALKIFLDHRCSMQYFANLVQFDDPSQEDHGHAMLVQLLRVVLDSGINDAKIAVCLKGLFAEDYRTGLFRWYPLFLSLHNRNPILASQIMRFCLYRYKVFLFPTIVDQLSRMSQHKLIQTQLWHEFSEYDRAAGSTEESRRLLHHFIMTLSENSSVAHNLWVDYQSTENSSLHNSVKKSILALKERYMPHVTDSTTLQMRHEAYSRALGELRDFCSQYVSSQDVAMQRTCQAALRLLSRLEHVSSRYNIHEATHMSIRDVIVLAWWAIGDEKAWLPGVAIEDARLRLVEGLYSIQRGGNISDGPDNLSDDMPICVSGAMNKIIEMLVGIDKDAAITMVNMTTASAKMLVVIREEASTYARYNDVSEENIIHHITSAVTARMWEEFAVLFPASPASQDANASEHPASFKEYIRTSLESYDYDAILSLKHAKHSA